MEKEKLLYYLNQIQDVMQANKDVLIDLDRVVGDGDLGLTMSDGFYANYVGAMQCDDSDLGKILYQGGKAMASAVPSTMGTLMASGIMNAAKAIKGLHILKDEDILKMLEAFEDGVVKRGNAKLGDKTFLDGFHPGLEVIQKALKNKQPIQDVIEKAYIATKKGYESTKGMIAVHGRAAIRGKESLDLLDPGAYVAVLLFEAFNK